MTPGWRTVRKTKDNLYTEERKSKGHQNSQQSSEFPSESKGKLKTHKLSQAVLFRKGLKVNLSGT